MINHINVFDCFGQRIAISKVTVNKPFTFDRAFGPDTSQDVVYRSCAQAAIESVIHGHNATIFAYGQTGEATNEPTDLHNLLAALVVVLLSFSLSPSH